MVAPRIKIIVDDRETRGPLPDALAQLDDFELSIERLPVGDYLIGNRLLIERKTLPDLVTSMKTERLFSQALRLAEAPNTTPLLLLEGTSEDLAGSAMRWECIQGALLALTVFIGLPVLRTRNADESARTLLFAGRQMRSIATESLTRRGYRPKGKSGLQRYILQGLPGVGPDKARRLIECFGNVREVMAADRDALLKVKGIGKTLAEKIDWAVRDEDDVCYLSPKGPRPPLNVAKPLARAPGSSAEPAEV